MTWSTVMIINLEEFKNSFKMTSSLEEIKNYFSTTINTKERNFLPYSGNGCKYMSINNLKEHRAAANTQPTDYSKHQHDYHAKKFKECSEKLTEMYKDKPVSDFYNDFKDFKLFNRWNLIESCLFKVSKLGTVIIDNPSYESSESIEKIFFNIKNDKLYNVFSDKYHDLGTSIISEVLLQSKLFNVEIVEKPVVPHGFLGKIYNSSDSETYSDSDSELSFSYIRIPDIEKLVIGKTVKEVKELYPSYRVVNSNKKFITFDENYFRLIVTLDEEGKITECKNT